MKKFRGKKRYYRNLAKFAENFRLELGGPDDWYDFWHQHFDWEGRGNQGGRERDEHTKAIFTAFENALEQLKEYKEPHQIWLSFSARQPTNDGLYFHTPNPNKNNFPYLFDEYNWDATTPEFLTPFMKDKYDLGVTEFDGGVWYAIKVREKA